MLYVLVYAYISTYFYVSVDIGIYTNIHACVDIHMYKYMFTAAMRIPVAVHDVQEAFFGASAQSPDIL